MSTVVTFAFRARPKSIPVLGSIGLLMASLSATQGADIAVPNGSFELPSTTFVDPRVDFWSKTPQPSWFDPSQTGGITWDQMSGVFANTAVGQPNHITNVDGTQALFLIALPQAGLTQVLSAAEAKFEVGFSYQLTVGVLGGGGIPEGTALQLGLFYLDGANMPVTVGSATVTYSAATFPTITQLVDQSLTVPVVQAGDAWAGKAIGISLVGMSGTGSGYWDLDNVRLTSSAVPEPGTYALLGVGLVGLGWSVRRRHRH
jgi:hypothetical protein